MRKKDADDTERFFGSEHAAALHKASPAIDLHADPLMWSRWVGYDLTKRHTPPLPGKRWVGHVDVPRLKQGGVGAQFFGLVSLPVFGDAGCFRAVDDQIEILRGVQATSAELRISRTASDIVEANAEGAIAALLGIEGAHALEGKLENVAHFARRGVRYLGLSHFSANETCFPCVGRGRDDARGLTAFGSDVVQSCFENGIIVDLAHINKRGFMEVCESAKERGVPVIDSHTGVVGAHKHLRNIDDDQIRALANTGGVMGVIFAPIYLGGNTIEAVVRHLNYMVNVAGEDHVALGSDYDGMVTPCPELGEVSMLPNLTDALIAAGWSDGRIEKLLRGNAMRVLNDVGGSTQLH